MNLHGNELVGLEAVGPLRVSASVSPCRAWKNCDASLVRPVMFPWSSRVNHCESEEGICTLGPVMVVI